MVSEQRTHDMFLGSLQHVVVSLHRADGTDRVRLGFADRDGNRMAPAELGLPPSIREEVRDVVTFTPIDGSTTELTVREYGYSDAQNVENLASRDGAVPGQDGTSLAMG